MTYINGVLRGISWRKSVTIRTIRKRLEKQDREVVRETAERRMFSKKIVESDVFLDMPLSTQALYFHLSMEADDDGFVNSPRKIQRMLGASDDDLKLLLAKNFLISFESGVVVVKHWKMNNYIQKDRYHKTIYIEEKKVLNVEENGSYSVKNGLYPECIQSMDTSCIQNGYKMDTEVSLGKVSKGKDSLGEVSIDEQESQTSESENSEKKKEKPKKAKKADIPKPPYYPNDEKLDEAFCEFVEFRKQMKKPLLTKKAYTRAFNRLEELSTVNGVMDNDLAIKIIEQSIYKCWTDLWELKNDSPKGNYQQPTNKQGIDFDALREKYKGE